MRKDPLLPALAAGLLSLTLGSCAANTIYRGVAVTALSDEELVTELLSAAKGYGIQLNRGMYLMAVRPEPAYVLTRSTATFTGSVNATYNAYAMPVGYGVALTGSSSGSVSGTAVTQYQYTDANAAARLGNSIAMAISRSRQNAYRRRALEVLAEYDKRVATRRQETEIIIQHFFSQNPYLQNRRLLVAAVAPWAASGGPQDGRAILQTTKEIIDSLPHGQGLNGKWYGTFAQTSITPQGEVFAFSQFVRLDLQQSGDSLRGQGILGTGEVIDLFGEVRQRSITAMVANTTSAINVTLTATAAPTQITGSFTGSGTGVRMEGTFTLLR